VYVFLLIFPRTYLVCSEALCIEISHVLIISYVNL
jgi:hypothetical protein